MTGIQHALAVQVFDRDGYYTTILASGESEIRSAVAESSARVPSCVACSVPYQFEWASCVPDVSLPADYRVELASVDREGKSEP